MRKPYRKFKGVGLGCLCITLSSMACEPEDSAGASAGDTQQTQPGTESGGQNCSIACSPGLQDCPHPTDKCTPYLCGDGCCTDATHCVASSGHRQAGESCYRDGSLGNDDCGKGLFCMPDQQLSGASGPGICHAMCKTVQENGGLNHCVELGFPADHVCFQFNDGSFPICIPPEDLSTELGEIEHPEREGQACGRVMDCGAGMGCIGAPLRPDCSADCANSPICGCCTVYCDANADAPEARCLGSEDICIPVSDAPTPGPSKLGVCIPPA